MATEEEVGLADDDDDDDDDDNDDDDLKRKTWLPNFPSWLKLSRGLSDLDGLLGCT